MGYFQILSAYSPGLIWGSQGLYTSAFVALLAVVYGKKTRRERYAITNIAAVVMSVSIHGDSL